MNKKETSSKYVTIYSNIDKVYVRKKKNKDNKWYLRTIPLKVIYKTIEHSNIKHPVFIKKGFGYNDVEYIAGKQLDKTFDDKAFIGLISNYIFELKKIDCILMKSYIKWKNNTEFLQYNATNVINLMKKSKYLAKLNVLGLNISLIDSYRGIRLDDQRNLTLIHGDLNRSNIINNNGNFYLIDWEYATYGDLAYELAMNFINENYSKEDMANIIERVCVSSGINQTNLINDISVYITFEYKRKSIIGFIECLNLKNKGLNYSFKIEEIYNDYSKIAGAISIENVKKVIG